MNTSIRSAVLAFVAGLLVISSAQAHDVGESGPAVRIWKMKDGATLNASFLYVKGDSVALEPLHGRVVHHALADLSPTDSAFAEQHYERIRARNHQHLAALAAANGTPPGDRTQGVLVWSLLGASLIAAILLRRHPAMRYVRYGVGVGGLAVFYAFTFRSNEPRTFATSPSFIDSAFTPFKPNVITSWDANYFYVGSNGIPAHEMMKGITAWQQQVPIPQCYLGQNSWQIPLNPVRSLAPIPVDQVHFTRGAIAIAVNGVCIFDPYTNTGVDALLDGQLDEWGGHSGRADDYHYHIAPLHLYNGSTTTALPLAFAFDGFPVYGSVEPDGSAMQPLDSNHGHIGANGMYHYHGTANAPYMIARFYGEVTEDTTHQLVPQPHANPVRPATSPLKGAVITGCVPNGANGYILSYTLSGQTYQVSYRWSQDGTYTFDFITPTGTTTQTYHGFTPCVIDASVETGSDASGGIHLSPNPAEDHFSITLDGACTNQDVEKIEIVNELGSRVFLASGYVETIGVSQIPHGTYFVFVSTKQRTFIAKLLVE